MVQTTVRPEPGPGSPTPSARRWRDVVVNDPRLSDAANQLLSEEVRAVVGADRVSVPSSRPHPSQGGFPLSAGPILTPTNNRLLIRSLLTAAIVIGAIIALTTRKWWVLPPAVFVLCVATWSIVAMVFGMLKTTEHPSAECTAVLQADGVRDPDQLFSAIVGEFTPGDKSL